MDFLSEAENDARSGTVSAEPRASAGCELVLLARRAVTNRILDEPVQPPPELLRTFGRPAGVFVTIRRVTGELRGCVGTQQPICDSVPEEVLRVAPLAAFADPRFPPVRREELPELRFEVSILTPLEPVSDIGQLDAARYGVTVEDALGRHALLLPGIPGIETVEVQLREVRRKAGISPEARIRIKRFEVEKFCETDA